MTDVLRNMGLFVATLAVFEAFRALQNRTRKVWQNPLLLSFVVIGVALTLSLIHISEPTRPY